MSPNDKTFLFVHIPKTGGQTFYNVLAEQYAGKPKLFFSSRGKFFKYMQLPLEKKLKYKLLQGHFAFRDESFFPHDRGVYFTFLREPVDRLISHYYFLFQNSRNKFHKEIVKNGYSMKQMLEIGTIKNLDNCMVRNISGNMAKSFGEIDENDLELAIRNFDKYFYHFGINEYYDESLLILARQLGWKMPYYRQLNIGTKKQKPDFDEVTWELVHHYNRLDEQLYNHALKKFNQRLEEYKDMLDNELPAFREKNKTYFSLRTFLYTYLGSYVFRV